MTQSELKKEFNAILERLASMTADPNKGQNVPRLLQIVREKELADHTTISQIYDLWQKAKALPESSDAVSDDLYKRLVIMKLNFGILDK